MRLLVYGGNGWIGSQFLDYLSKHDVSFHRGESRCDNVSSVIQEIETIEPTHLVCFLGRTHKGQTWTIDDLESDIDINLRDNLFCPVILAILGMRYGVHTTYLGTGCIFNGYDKIYTEDDVPDFKGSGYSLVKGYTDRLMQQLPVLNLRIRMPIIGYDHPRNMITKLKTYAKICSMPNSMTVLEDFFPVIWDMIQKKTTGTFHCVNPDPIEHDEILRMYKEYVDPDIVWSNMTLEEQDQILKSQRSNNHLDTHKISSLYPEIPDIRTSLRRLLSDYNRK
jgi:dTDP-4-dehydrorhamnose reductase